MSLPQEHRSTLLVTLGGSLTGFFNALLAEDLVRTCLLATAGTVVSFFVTVGLKWVFRKWKP